MDSAAAVMQYVNFVLFAGLAVVCLRLARKRGTTAAMWAAATFGVLGVVSGAGLFLPDDQDEVSQVVVKFLLLGIVAYPYALYRFARSFERLPRVTDAVVLVATVVVVVSTLLLPRLPDEGEVRPAWFQVWIVVFIVYWVGVSVMVARRLWRGGRGLPAVARNRMRTLALGAVGLGLALLPGLVPEEEQPVGLEFVTMLLPVSAALLFYVGLVPPGWLRAAWRRPDLVALRRVELELVRAHRRDQVLAAVLPHAAALVGGRTATFTSEDDPGAGGWDARAVSVVDDTDPVIRLPVAGGWLVVEAGPHAPFFGDDEIDMLRSLAGFVDLVLERTDLLERERSSRAAAERTSSELETLVYGISHDLKSPVISLLGYLEYLREDYAPQLGDEGKHYLDRMEKSALYMQELLADLLELSRVGRVAIDATEVDLASLVSDVIVDAHAKFPTASVVAESLPTIVVNQARARQLFTNLIENAARHGGRPDITIRVFGAVREDGSAVVSVADDGVGIPPEYREKAFGIFERLAPRDSASGTGIGLALCRKIVETTGGDIAIVDSPVGTHIRMTFPSAVVRSVRSQAAEVSP